MDEYSIYTTGNGKTAEGLESSKGFYGSRLLLTDDDICRTESKAEETG